MLASAAFGAEQKFQQAQDMRYGATLYEYFQGNNFDALSTLMVAERRGGIRWHTDNAALIEGGISLAFGLEHRAAELFEQQLLLTESTDPQLPRYQRIAWQKLAELSYRKRDWEASRTQLEKAGAGADAEINADLAVNLALRSGDLARAEQLLADSDTVLAVEQRALGLINLGAALARAGQFSAAAQHYRNAATIALSGQNAKPEQETEKSAELALLADRARTGAGYALSLRGDYAQALEQFRTVRLHTPLAESALLGMGWAAINGGEYRQAIDALQFLTARDTFTGRDALTNRNALSPEVQEALVALPFSYEKLARPKAALLAYQNAEQQYRGALAELRTLATEIHSLPLIDSSGETGWQYGWLQGAPTPPLLRDNRRYLRGLLRDHGFQLQLAELRDLQQLQRVLDDWRARLPHFNQLIAERETRRQEIVAGYGSAQFDQQLEFAQQRYRQMQAQLARIEQQGDWAALATGEQRELLSMVEDAEARFARLRQQDKARPAQGETLQRARGLLLWQASQNYHDNLWQQRKVLQQLEVELRSAEQNLAGVDGEAARAPQLHRLQSSVTDARSRLQTLQQQTDRAAADIEAAIRRDLAAEIRREEQRIGQYIAHTQLAIARLHDSALLGSSPGAPPVAEATDNAAVEAAQ